MLKRDIMKQIKSVELPDLVEATNLHLGFIKEFETIKDFRYRGLEFRIQDDKIVFTYEIKQIGENALTDSYYETEFYKN